MRYLSSFQSPQWGLNVKVKVTWSGTHGCSAQEAARFCECQRVNKACHASLTSVSYDQHYGRSISDSLVKFLVRLAAQLALNSFSSSCHGNSNCGFCRVLLILKTELFGTFVCIFVRNMLIFVCRWNLLRMRLFSGYRAERGKSSGWPGTFRCQAISYFCCLNAM